MLPNMALNHQHLSTRIRPSQRPLVCLLALLPLGIGHATPAKPFGSRFEEIKKQAAPAELYRLLYDLPKGGDLHNHINLSFPAEDWLALATDPRRARRNQFYTRIQFANCPDSKEPFVRFQTIQRATFRKLSPCQQAEYVALDALTSQQKELWLSSIKLDRPGEGRDEFFNFLGVRLGELSRDPELVLDLLVADMQHYQAEKLRYVETQSVGLRWNQPDGTPLGPQQAVRLLRERLQQADAKATGVTIRFLATVVRFEPNAEEQLAQAYAIVAENRDLWVGINLTGKEEVPAGHGLRFLEAFRRMRRQYSNIPISIHAGETEAPGHEVRTALLLGAARVGHAVNLLSDPDTLLLLRGGRYLLEMNLISNILLGYVPALAGHPFPEYLRLGIPVCLNTDDRTAWDSNLTDEYYAALTTFNLSWSEVVQLGEDSLRYSFADPDTKEALLKDYHNEVDAFTRKYDGSSWQAQLRSVTPVISGFASRRWSIR
jgi:adenosine deaminase CECR1